jgi:hypothetical protein
MNTKILGTREEYLSLIKKHCVYGSPSALALLCGHSSVCPIHQSSTYNHSGTDLDDLTSVCLSVCLTVCLSVCPSVLPSTQMNERPNT